MKEYLFGTGSRDAVSFEEFEAGQATLMFCSNLGLGGTSITHEAIFTFWVAYVLIDFFAFINFRIFRRPSSRSAKADKRKNSNPKTESYGGKGGALHAVADHQSILKENVLHFDDTDHEVQMVPVFFLFFDDACLNFFIWRSRFIPCSIFCRGQKACFGSVLFEIRLRKLK